MHEEWQKLLPMVSAGGVGKLFWTGPNMPADAVEVLRKAYLEVTEDPANVAELGKVMGGGSSLAKPAAIPGEDAQKVYVDATKVFNENVPFYKELQAKYWDEWWN